MHGYLEGLRMPRVSAGVLKPCQRCSRRLPSCHGECQQSGSMCGSGFQDFMWGSDCIVSEELLRGR